MSFSPLFFSNPFTDLYSTPSYYHQRAPPAFPSRRMPTRRYHPQPAPSYYSGYGYDDDDRYYEPQQHDTARCPCEDCDYQRALLMREHRRRELIQQQQQEQQQKQRELLAARKRAVVAEREAAEEAERQRVLRYRQALRQQAEQRQQQQQRQQQKSASNITNTTASTTARRIPIDGLPTPSTSASSRSTSPSPSAASSSSSTSCSAPGSPGSASRVVSSAGGRVVEIEDVPMSPEQHNLDPEDVCKADRVHTPSINTTTSE